MSAEQSDPLPLRERKKAAQRNTLMRTAVKLFREHGVDAVGVDDIARDSMCSRTTLHRYFGNKEDILFGTAGQRLSGLSARVDAAGHDEDPWLVARVSVRQETISFVETIDPDLRVDCMRLWFTEAPLLRRYTEILLEYEEILARFFAARIGADPDLNIEAQVLASSITSAVRSAMKVAVASDVDVGPLLDNALDLIEAGPHASTRARPNPRDR